jgi:Zn-dependent protease/CBS domain-containing protein
MRWSLKIAEVQGIKIFVHWTFLILVGWIFMLHLGEGQGVALALKGVGFILAIFACVVLHELGHALTAARYHIRTRDITLLPIGGVARLERMPREPLHELWVALAGPAVNVVIATLLFGVLLVSRSLAPLSVVWSLSGSFLNQLMWVNLFLVAFNLVPAFPMDGGRVLRALLATRLDYARATEIAARIGQGLAILFGFAGLFRFPMLVFIALFVFIGAQEEAQMVQLTTSMRGLKVQDAMITRFRSLSAEDTLAVATTELIAGSQHDFPVTQAGEVVGVLTRNDLVRALAQNGSETKVGDVMRSDCHLVTETEMLDKSYELLRQDNCSTLPVVRNGRLVGMITLENIAEWVMVNTALHHVTSASQGVRS